MNQQQKLDQIELKLEDLTGKQLALQKKQLEQHKEYERQKTTYQLLFGQPSLPQDPELVSVTAQIADLKEQRKEYFKVIQVHILLISGGCFSAATRARERLVKSSVLFKDLKEMELIELIQSICHRVH
jgi:hypothetical protein